MGPIIQHPGQGQALGLSYDQYAWNVLRLMAVFSGDLIVSVEARG